MMEMCSYSKDTFTGTPIPSQCDNNMYAYTPLYVLTYVPFFSEKDCLVVATVHVYIYGTAG